MRPRGSEFQQSTQFFPSTNRCSTQGFLARQRHQELISSSLLLAFLLVWSIGIGEGKDKWKGSAGVVR